MPDGIFRENISKQVGQILDENRDLEFDIEMARRICEMYALPLREHMLGPKPTMTEFLGTLQSEESRTEFLAHYLAEQETRNRIQARKMASA